MISVVIPTCERNDLLALCLERLAPGRQQGMAWAAAGLPSDDRSGYEVIISDDGRRATAEAMIRTRFPWALWTAGPRLGPAANRNHGARQARGDWVVFTDDDCIPDPDWLQAFARNVTPNGSALEGAIHALGSLEGMVECPVNTSGGHFWSANIAVRREVFFRLGGFDQNFPNAAQEDQDIFQRLGGATVVPFVPAAVVRHPVRPVSLRQKLRSLPAAFDNWVYYFVKHDPAKPHPEWRLLRSVFRMNAPHAIRNILCGRYGWALINLCNLAIAVSRFRPAMARARARLSTAHSENFAIESH